MLKVWQAKFHKNSNFLSRFFAGFHRRTYGKWFLIQAGNLQGFAKRGLNKKAEKTVNECWQYTWSVLRLVRFTSLPAEPNGAEPADIRPRLQRRNP
jgi:hypothetical protein